MKKSRTPKLFYSEYPYKIEWRSEFAHYFRNSDLSFAREVLDRCQQQLEESNKVTLRNWHGERAIPREELFLAQRFYSNLVNSDINFRIRVEGNSMAVYSTERDWLYQIGQSVNAYEFWEPSTELVPNTVIMGPKMKGWEYKITLGSNVPADFHEWATNNIHKLKIGNTLLESLQKGYKYLDGYYFYVRNEKMLNLVTLVLGSGVRRIDKILIEDKNA